MTNTLVIVESPSKAKTLRKYFGKGFTVMASYGHVRDLVPKEGAVDPNNNFSMNYQTIERNSKHVNEIIKALKKCDELYLAPDPDREGEAIAWHLLEILKEKVDLSKKKVCRIVFNEITKTAIKEAAKHPREISSNLVDAQQARRALDFLVGFTLSPLLWRKIRAGLSAGRVQSPALRLIVERELEIEKFQSREYWTIHAYCVAHNESFSSRLITYNNEKLEQFTLTNEKQTATAVEEITAAAKGKLLVSNVVKKKRYRKPTPPFITSTLQQEASRKLGFTTQRTMRVAQSLYEGVDTGDETVGLITYMRTDSVHLANEAIENIRKYIETTYGKDYLPDTANIYKTKSKNAQEAHEAIRPTSCDRTPDLIKKHLDTDQLKLYQLIFQRTIASQMVPATIDTMAADLQATPAHVFRANGNVLVHPGYLKVYQEGSDTPSKITEDKQLPPLQEGQIIDLNDITPEQHFTEPPPRYTEASLVKTLEEFDIGRPSTYAAIIATLKNRKYVELEKKRFYPTDVGRVVIRFLKNHFGKYVDYNFTASLEDQLDIIARGETEWIPVLKEFWFPFKESIDHVFENVKRSDVTQEPIDEKCPKCDKPLAKRLGKSGLFIGCSGYPDCDYTRNINNDKNENDEELVAAIKDRNCPQCQSDLVIKNGPYGKFIGCSSYPDCKFIESLNKPEDTQVSCPMCKKGSILKRLSRRKKVFFSCSKYPSCKYALWNKPIDEECPQCHWPITCIKITKKFGTQRVCPQDGCKFSEQTTEEEIHEKK